VRGAFERLVPLADPLILGVHRRWIEHELGQRAITVAEQTARPAQLPGSVEVTFLFCDLKDFTAYAETRGDAAAIIAIDRFFDVVTRERGDGGQLVKSPIRERRWRRPHASSRRCAGPDSQACTRASTAGPRSRAPATTSATQST
jgi:hypothetical protein